MSVNDTDTELSVCSFFLEYFCYFYTELDLDMSILKSYQICL